MIRANMIARLLMHLHDLKIMQIAAEKEHMPTAITMGLQWLRDDTVKVIADLDPDFEMPED